MIKKLLYKFHRILGTLLSILFVLWFLSGFVMIYHNFPKISNSEKYKGLVAIDIHTLHHCDSILSALNSNSNTEYCILKAKSDGNFLIETKDKDNTYLTDQNGTFGERYTYSEIYNYASNLNTSTISRIDTIHSLDRWLPYDKYIVDFPAYKFHYKDSLQSELYVSSLSGEGIQYTNSDNRFWAWIGAIPHWLYIANLRHNTDLWKGIVIWLSGIGSLLCITGLIIGFRSFYKRYKQKKEISSPYKRFAYKWHHILGFIFGIFVFTFAFSGMMSLQKVPQWIIKTYNTDFQTTATLNPLKKHPLEYALNYKTVLHQYAGSIKKLEWASFGDLDYYKAVIGDSMHYIDATSDRVKPLCLSQHDIKKRLQAIHPEPITIEELHDYDNYYIHKRNKLPLPVYKVSVADRDKSLYYINPYTADISYFNTNTKARKWTYQALHSFSIKWLLDRPVLWNILMWTTMIAGTFISLTGLYLSYKAIRRKLRKKE